MKTAPLKGTAGDLRQTRSAFGRSTTFGKRNGFSPKLPKIRESTLFKVPSNRSFGGKILMRSAIPEPNTISGGEKKVPVWLSQLKTSTNSRPNTTNSAFLQSRRTMIQQMFKLAEERKQALNDVKPLKTPSPVKKVPFQWTSEKLQKVLSERKRMRLLNQSQFEEEVRQKSSKKLTFDESISEPEAGEESDTCIFRNLLKHYEKHSSKMKKIREKFLSVDDVFLRTLVGEMRGCNFGKFREYQRKKQELYRKMQEIEKELEAGVIKELNMSERCKNYLKKREDLLEESSGVNREFERIVMNALEGYEEGINKTHNVKEQILASTPDKPLRRSKRLKNISKNESDKENKAEDSIIRKNSASTNKKKAVHVSIFKDESTQRQTPQHSSTPLPQHSETSF